MLIALHSSLVQELTADVTSEGLENLAQARREGRHMLFADRNTLEAIIAADHLSSRSRATYNVVYNRLAEKKSFASSLCRIVEIVSDSYGPIASRANGEAITIQIPIGALDSELVQRTLLLGENLTDMPFFDWMAKVYAHRRRMGSVQLSFDATTGGGSTTASVYSAIQSAARRLCLCVADSDQKSPNGAVGTTARMLKKVDNAERPMAELAILNAREIENLLPLPVLSGAHGVDPAAIFGLERLASSSAAHARVYVNVKEGTSVERILRFPVTSPDRTYWLHVLSTLAKEMQHLRGECVTSETCGAPDGCSCVINTGLGPNILERASKVCEQMSPKKLAECLDSLSVAEWDRIGALVLAWCCGAPNLRAA